MRVSVPLRTAAMLAALTATLAACQDAPTAAQDSGSSSQQSALSQAGVDQAHGSFRVSRENATRPSQISETSDLDPEAVDRIVAMVDRINAGFEASGNQLRLNYPWLFRVGTGTDPFGRLRTGSRWPQSSVTYVLDTSDYTTDSGAVDVDGSLVSSYENWNAIPNSSIQLNRVADSGGNFDFLDATVIHEGVCVDIVDTSSPNVLSYNPATGALSFAPEAGIVMGGWLGLEYFEKCLGSRNIIGVTWSFRFGDVNSDNYVDQVYAEELYNDEFIWVTSGSPFLSPIMDVESISVHENGHAVGLGHFGGPINRQPFSLKPNGRVFNPEAVMNPFYLGGEKRDPLNTDAAALLTLYGRNN